MPYWEPRSAGNARREAQMRETEGYIARLRRESAAARGAYFRPDASSEAAYAESLGAYRRDYIEMLGRPLSEPGLRREPPRADVEFVAEDEYGRIERLAIHAAPDLGVYGILFTPPGGGPRPLVISQHGGGGTPELCSGFLDETAANYNDMTRRALARGFTVFAPQLHLWGEGFGPANDRLRLDNELKQSGGSMAALDVFKLVRAIDYFEARGDVLADRIGIVGLSYGGFYALYAAAAEPRLAAAASSCFFNDRFRYAWSDFIWKDSGNRFLDAEVCGLICPRPLYVEVGLDDELFDAADAKRLAPEAAAYYERLGLGDRFVFSAFPGTHELSKGRAIFDFLERHLKGGR